MTMSWNILKDQISRLPIETKKEANTGEEYYVDDSRRFLEDNVRNKKKIQY